MGGERRRAAAEACRRIEPDRGRGGEHDRGAVGGGADVHPDRAVEMLPLAGRAGAVGGDGDAGKGIGRRAAGDLVERVRILAGEQAGDGLADRARHVLDDRRGASVPSPATVGASFTAATLIPTLSLSEAEPPVEVMVSVSAPLTLAVGV